MSGIDDDLDINDQLLKAKELLVIKDLEIQELRQQVYNESQQRRKLDKKLQERLKELTLMYSVSKIVETYQTVDEILQAIVSLIPSALRYSEMAHVQMIYSGKKFKTENFKPSPCYLNFIIVANDNKVADLFVCYHLDITSNSDDFFSKEEKLLLNVLCERIGRIIERSTAQLSEKDKKNRYSMIFKDIEESSFFCGAASSSVERDYKQCQVSAIKHLVRDVAHELSNVIHGVLGNLNIFRLKNKDNLLFTDRLFEAEDILKNSSSLINSLQQISKNINTLQEDGGSSDLKIDEAD